MKRMLLPRWGLLLVCLGLAGGVLAQVEGGPPGTDTEPTATQPASPGNEGEPATPPPEAEEVVPEDKYLEKSGEYLVEMRALLTKGLERLREAREAKDAVQLTCVNEQVTAMKGILRVSEDAFIALQEAQATASAERARYEFSKIRVSRQKMKELYQSALNCAGAEATVSNTTVEVEIDPSIAEDDPYYGDPDFFYTPADTLARDSTGELGDTTDPPYVRPPPASGTI